LDNLSFGGNFQSKHSTTGKIDAIPMLGIGYHFRIGVMGTAHNVVHGENDDRTVFVNNSQTLFSAFLSSREIEFPPSRIVAGNAF
jgi:hypothetical protein